MLDDVDEAETEVKNLNYRAYSACQRVGARHRVFQLLDVVELELLSSRLLLRVFVGDAPRRCCDSDRRVGKSVTWTADATAALAVAVLEVWSELLELDPCYD